MWSSILTARLVVVKIALHSGWINQALHRSFGRELAGAAGGVSAGAAPRSAPPRLNAERRAFHCRRYTDSNGNGRCDLGECVSLR